VWEGALGRPPRPAMGGSLDMTKRYREDVDVTTEGEDLSTPTSFRWRGQGYQVVAVLGHWREDAGYWSGGGGVEVPQRDLWRVEAQGGTRAQGIYELVREAKTWRMERVWD
jgi:hypothetical protein